MGSWYKKDGEGVIFGSQKWGWVIVGSQSWRGDVSLCLKDGGGVYRNSGSQRWGMVILGPLKMGLDDEEGGGIILGNFGFGFKKKRRGGRSRMRKQALSP